MLTENDVAKIRRLFQRVTQLESMLSQQSFNAYTGSPAFLIKAPTGGIPAKVGNVPGYAVCNMVRLWSNDAPQDKELAQMDTVQPVRNLGEAVPEDEIVIAHRDGFGDFFIGVGAGASIPECSIGGVTIPGLADSPIVDALDADYVVGIRDGCTVLIEVAECVDEPEPSGSPASPSQSQISDSQPVEPEPIEGSLSEIEFYSFSFSEVSEEEEQEEPPE